MSFNSREWLRKNSLKSSTPVVVVDDEGTQVRYTVPTLLAKNNTEEIAQAGFNSESVKYKEVAEDVLTPEGLLIKPFSGKLAGETFSQMVIARCSIGKKKPQKADANA